MKITSRHYYDHKHQRWAVEHKIVQYLSLDTSKEKMKEVQAETEAYIREGLEKS